MSGTNSESNTTTIILFRNLPNFHDVLLFGSKHIFTPYQRERERAQTGSWQEERQQQVMVWGKASCLTWHRLESPTTCLGITCSQKKMMVVVKGWKHPSTLKNTLSKSRYLKHTLRNSHDNSHVLVRLCRLSVRKVCECLHLPLAMSRICQGCYGSVWRYLRVSGGCLEGVEG